MWTSLTRRSGTKQKQHRRFAPGLESLEDRCLLSAAIPGVTLDPMHVPKFENDVPNALDPSFIFQPTKPGGNRYEIGIYQTVQDLGLTDKKGNPLPTTVWGYGTSPQDTTYPGRTIVAQENKSIIVHWTNNLVDAEGNPLPHLLPVDSTLHWADPFNAGEHGPNPYTGPVPVVTHLHGGHTRSDSDGLPDAWFTPGFEYTGRLFNEVYTYDNDQPATTLWYHDHALGITRLNVYAGLAGFYILRDRFDTGQVDDPSTPPNENPSNLPAGPYEIPLVIQDRLFTKDGQLYYPSEPESKDQPDPSVLPEFFGDTILVNGKAWPKLDVEPRVYRLRLLNGSDSRFYNLHFEESGPTIYQIGTDGGLLPAPVPLHQLLLAPAERADVLIDFSGQTGKTLLLHNNAPAPFKGTLTEGELVYPKTTSDIMAFNVVKPLNPSIPDQGVPPTLIPPITPLTQTGSTRGLMLFEGTDSYGRLQPLLGIVDPTSPNDGTLLWDDPITENPRLNDAEVWEIYNATEDAHPIHLHLVQFQIINRQAFEAEVMDKELPDGGGPFTPMGGKLTDIEFIGDPIPPNVNEDGWKDTVIMNPGEVTRIIAKFDRRGEYVWHCHILSHEDHEMMRPFYVGNIPPGMSRTATSETQVAFVADVASAIPVPISVLTPVATVSQVEAPAAPVNREMAAPSAEAMSPVARLDQQLTRFDDHLDGGLLGSGSTDLSDLDTLDQLLADWGQHPPGAGLFDDVIQGLGN
jgi:spore coat protein A